MDVKVMLYNLEIDKDAMCATQDSERGLNLGLGGGTPTTNDIQELQDFVQARL